MEEVSKDKDAQMEAHPMTEANLSNEHYPMKPNLPKGLNSSVPQNYPMIPTYPMMASDGVMFHHTPVPNPPPEFHTEDKRYKCCCRCCHSTTGCMIIGVVEILWALAGLIFQISTNQYRVNVASSAVPFVVTCLIVGLMLFGVKKEKPSLLIVHMIFQIIAIIGFVIAVILLIIALIYFNWDNLTWFERWSLATLVVAILAAAFQIWFFVVVLSCYRYLKDKIHFYLLAVHPSSVAADPAVAIFRSTEQHASYEMVS